jgi:phospholipid transport system substrate-binding protein
MRNIILALAVALIVVLAPATASAGPATDLVKQKQQQLFKVVAQPKSAAQQAKLRALFDEMLAYDVMSRASLGKKWDERSDAEKKHFSELLTQIIRNNYKRNLKKMLDYDIHYLGEKKKDGGTLVKSVAKHKKDKREPAIEIDFQIDKVKGTLMVVDIVTERASLVKTYKAQFLKILKKDGFDKLIEKMEKKKKEQQEKA